jgi:hypothetical protein
LTPEHVLAFHTDGFIQALIRQDYDRLEAIYSDSFRLIRPDGSVLNKEQVLNDLRERGLRFHSIVVEEPTVRVFGSTAILTAVSRTVSSRNGRRRYAHSRFVAVYTREADLVTLVHFQSTMLPHGGVTQTAASPSNCREPVEATNGLRG